MSLFKNDPDSTKALGDANKTHVQESTKMPNEILNLIFEAVPVEHRASMCRISTRRKMFIEKIGSAVDPVFVGDVHLRSPTYVPHYPAHISTRLNPAINDTRYPVLKPSANCRPH